MNNSLQKEENTSGWLKTNSSLEPEDYFSEKVRGLLGAFPHKLTVISSLILIVAAAIAATVYHLCFN